MTITLKFFGIRQKILGNMVTEYLVFKEISRVAVPFLRCIFICVCVCMHVCIHTNMLHVCECPRRPEDAVRFPELELLVVVSCPK